MSWSNFQHIETLRESEIFIKIRHVWAFQSVVVVHIWFYLLNMDIIFHIIIRKKMLIILMPSYIYWKGWMLSLNSKSWHLNYNKSLSLFVFITFIFSSDTRLNLVAYLLKGKLIFIFFVRQDVPYNPYNEFTYKWLLLILQIAFILFCQCFESPNPYLPTVFQKGIKLVLWYINVLCNIP